MTSAYELDEFHDANRSPNRRRSPSHLPGSMFALALMAACSSTTKVEHEIGTTAQPLTTVIISRNDQQSDFVQYVGQPNTIVQLNADLNLTGYESISIASGVQIIGDSSMPHGPALSTTAFPRALFVLDSVDAVRISGVRIKGGMNDDPFSAVDQSDSTGIRVNSSSNVEIDHCEIDHWRGDGVLLAGIAPGDGNGFKSGFVHDNFIHHNQHPTNGEFIPGGGHGAGYGVEVAYGGFGLIERNVFDYNRHAIAGGDGSYESGYFAYDNLILREGGIGSGQLGFTIYTHAIDMHGQNDCGHFSSDHNCGPAGKLMNIGYNTILYRRSSTFSNPSAIHLRGTPQLAMNVFNNVFAHDQDGAIEQNESGLEQWSNTFGLDTLGGPVWIDTDGDGVGDTIYIVSDVKYCDFDGDGGPDSFLATGAGWWFTSSRGDGRWQFLYRSTTRAANVTLGDTNGDGRCDVSGDGQVLTPMPPRQCEAGQSQACGNCGTRSCGSSFTWGACSNQGVCTPGSLGSTPCGNQCGTITNTCSNSCQWVAGTTCNGGGVCSPGQTRSCCPCPYGQACNHQGEQTCTSGCSFSSCQGYACGRHQVP